MNEVLIHLGFMKWPFIVLSLTAFALSLERLWVLGQGHYLSRQVIKGEHEINESESLAHASLKIQHWVAHWRARLSILSLMGTLSPLMGLFGTVCGLVVMFQTIAGTNQSVTPALLADGLWEAMYSTVVGLAIAIPCLLLSGFFRAWQERLQTHLILHINGQFVDKKESRC